MTLTVTVHADAEEVTADAAGFLAAQIGEVIRVRGGCVIALSGGSTPLPVYQRLRRLPVHWPKVAVIQTDERLDRPYAVEIGRALGLDRSQPQHTDVAVWSPIPAGAPGNAAVAYARQLAVLRPGDVPDIAVLGLGTDGHTAAVFDHLTGSGTGEPVVATVYREEPRVGLTAAYLRAIPTKVLLATGAGKRDALSRVVSPPGDRPRVPAAVVLAGDGYVFADRAACPEGY
ncbi:6-phosphogluconolactonase [Nocardia sp. alder85J]|uniref:6-phosphogluconolactonase n=1 Tax=Nocardia sp. alder85J TaxID=2862949 RepID=UPI001CD3BF24|nr:6-phosphogluconolactonase [Nocardia sp. alder85J]MCX4097926.1 6-phosphogluconolactonase [Nocardia sp. alder85J]